MVVVSNTSPISNLATIGQIGLLQQIYPQILIPPTVHSELMGFVPIQPQINDLLSRSWLKIQPVNNFTLVNTLQIQLDPGEAEAISLALELNANRLLIDERLGRSIATQYGLKIRGILGLLINAKEQGLIQVLKPILDDLIDRA
ncbi:MAG: DUF3368 domain-containing protein [Geitlerinemataceae cyanobacterium]